MKAAIILALSLSYAAPAFSQPANRAAEREARLFFIPCKQYPKAQQNECLDNQDGFTDEYAWAKGAYSADPDQPFQAIVITDSGDPDHAVHYAL